MAERFLVTGALGCIGAWVVRRLADEGVPVVALDAGTDRSRLELVAGPERSAAATFVTGDITDAAGVAAVVDTHAITHVIHLAGVLVPAARARPALAALVNVVGTANVFEAARDRPGQIAGLAYASSAAVFDLADGVRVAEDADGHPANHYGVHKQAAEGMARVFWADDGVASIGLRPCVVYGPGRDAGQSAAPTLAMRAAAEGRPFHIPFGGRLQFHFAPDVAAAFIRAAREARSGAIAANVGGPARPMGDLVAAVTAAVPGARITYDDVPLPNPEELGSGAFPVSLTGLEDGVAQTIDHFRSSPPQSP